MEMSPLLSICIPTYNRCKLLSRLISSIKDCRRFDEIEVCISNNASSDGTSVYLDRISKDFKNIHFFSFAEKVGVDENMHQAASMANGEYVYLIGDDDKVLPHCVEELLHLLEERPNLLIVNGFKLELDSVCKYEEGIKKKSVFELTKNYYFKNPYEAYEMLCSINMSMPGHLGIYVVSNSFKNEVFWATYYGSFHAYEGAIWDFLDSLFKRSLQVKIHLSPSRVIQINSRNHKTWEDRFLEMHLVIVPSYMYSLPSCFRESSRKYLLKKQRRSRKLLKKAIDKGNVNLHALLRCR